MKSTNYNKISEEILKSINKEMTCELAKRLEDENHDSSLDGLKDWHLLRTLDINRPDLTFDYIHLVEQ